MCEYFVKADPIQYEQRTRSIRIRGMLTSIRLENTVWDVLAEMAEDEGCTTNALICQLHDEIMDHRGEVSNFASFLRVTSLRYLRRCLISQEKKQQDMEQALNINLPTRSMGTPHSAQTVRGASKALAAVKS
ncbi:MAG: aryl-sulfate sulfotransferase [Betaproteobacteria bacterium]|nr:aryl-sulfate sulfotransferase [Betaproteobacteria bacterium]